MISLFAEAVEAQEKIDLEKNDSGLPISCEEAVRLLNSFPQETSDKNHYLMSSAVMRGLARHFGENEEYWGMLGLLHDVDWSLTKKDVAQHTMMAVDILKEKGFDDEFIRLVQSHGYSFDLIPAHIDKKRENKIEFCLAAGETLTGIVYSYALMRGGRISDMQVKGLRKKFKDKNFAAGCNRDIIREIERTGMSLDELFEVAIFEIGEIKDVIGLV